MAVPSGPGSATGFEDRFDSLLEGFERNPGANRKFLRALLIDDPMLPFGRASGTMR